MPLDYQYHQHLAYRGFIVYTIFMALKHLFQVFNFLTFTSMLLQALHANALPVLDMCKQWLAQYM